MNEIMRIANKLEATLCNATTITRDEWDDTMYELPQGADIVTKVMNHVIQNTLYGCMWHDCIDIADDDNMTEYCYVSAIIAHIPAVIKRAYNMMGIYAQLPNVSVKIDACANEMTTIIMDWAKDVLTS